MEYRSIHTRFRAYQLGSKGASFSYFANNEFVLGEARYNDDNIASIEHELKKCGKTSIDSLYISSWDIEHCNSLELQSILEGHQPSKIYYPRHEPDPEKQNQIDSKKLIDEYTCYPPPLKSNGSNITTIAQPWSYDYAIHRQELTGIPNDDSLICLFRNGNFSVLGVGDLESQKLSEELAKSKILKETDVLILSHHGSSKDFTTTDFLRAINPSVCIALVDRENQYGHPDATVYQRVYENSWYCSTKDGDVIIETNGWEHNDYTVYNYISNGERLNVMKTFGTKRLVAYRKSFGF